MKFKIFPSMFVLTAPYDLMSSDLHGKFFMRKTSKIMRIHTTNAWKSEQPMTYTLYLNVPGFFFKLGTINSSQTPARIQRKEYITD